MADALALKPCAVGAFDHGAKVVRVTRRIVLTQGRNDVHGNVGQNHAPLLNLPLAHGANVERDMLLPGRYPKAQKLNSRAGIQHGLRNLQFLSGRLKLLIVGIIRVALEHGVALAPKVEIDAFVQMKTLARLGVGNTVLSRAAVADEVARGELHAVPITQPRLERRMVLARAGSRPVSR